MHCHIPPLLDIPEGDWKCCECTAINYKKKMRCGACDACLREDCGKCSYCLDVSPILIFVCASSTNQIQLTLFEHCCISQRTKFGGQGIKKQVCIYRDCPLKRFAPPASSGPILKKKKRELELQLQLEELTPAKTEANAESVYDVTPQSARTAKSKQNYNASNVSNGGAASFPRSWKNPEIASAKRQDSGASKSGHGNDSDEVTVSDLHIMKDENRRDNTASDGGESDAYSQATHPFLGIDNVGGATADDLFLCQQELKHAQSENKRQAEEIKRLKTAIQALATSLAG